MRIKFHPIIKTALLWMVSPRATRLLFKVPGANPEDTHPRSILVVRLDEIGDTVLTSPFLRGLRKTHSRSTITLVVKPEVVNLFELCPYVDEVLGFDWRAPAMLAPFVRHLRAYKLAREKLWDKKFDLAVIPRLDNDYYHATFLAYFSKAKRRVAFSESVNTLKSFKNRGYDLLLTDAVKEVPSGHETRINLSLLRFIQAQVTPSSVSEKILRCPPSSKEGEYAKDEEFGPEIWLSEEDRAFAGQCLPNAESRYIVLAPGATSATRQWPVERYLALSKWCVAEFGAVMVVVGGTGERGLGAFLAAGLPQRCCIDVTGKTTLRQSAAVMERCRLFIGNDSGPKHLAAALGLDVVEISRFPRGGSSMHPQAPDRFRAWGCRNIVLQPPRPSESCNDTCFADRPHCILGVEIAAVQAAVLELLEDNSHQPVPLLS